MENLSRDNTFVDRLRVEKAFEGVNDNNLSEKLADVITSQEFQEYIIPNILKSYPEKKRLFFIHLPKCAGTDLTSQLLRVFPSINFRMAEPSWMPGDSFLLEIKQVALRLETDDNVFIHGHLSLDWWLRQNLHRPQDSIFTVLRHPADIAISKINYVLQRFSDDPDAECVDTKDFLSIIGISKICKSDMLNNKTALCREMLYNPNITIANSMCNYLGDGTFSSALANLMRADVEVTTLETYKQWTTKRWKFERHTRINASTKFILPQNLNEEDLAYIACINIEDQRLFAHVQNRIRLTGRPSIRGHALGKSSLLKKRFCDKLMKMGSIYR